MSYVPIVPSTYAPPPSPRTRELAELLGKVLEEYSNAHPAVTKSEVRAAIRMAQMSAGPDQTKLALGLSLGIGLGVMMLTLGLFYFRSVGDVEITAIFPMVILGIIVLLGLVAVMVKMKGS